MDRTVASGAADPGSTPGECAKKAEYNALLFFLKKYASQKNKNHTDFGGRTLYASKSPSGITQNSK